MINSAATKLVEERELGRGLDAYLLGIRFHPAPSDLKEHIARFRDSRLAPFLERAGLTGDLSDMPEEQFREGVLRLRCYLAEPDDPPEELLTRLRAIAALSRVLRSALEQEMNPLELKRALRPLQKSLASVAPELHPLCYAIAEHLARIGEHSPEDPNQLHQETIILCYEWLHRLHAYWYAVLGWPLPRLTTVV